MAKIKKIPIAELVANAQGSVARAKDLVRALKTRPKLSSLERLLFVSVGTAMSIAALVLVQVSVSIGHEWKEHRKSVAAELAEAHGKNQKSEAEESENPGESEHEETAEVADEHEGHGEGESQEAVFTQNPIPKEIRDRQDGEMESGHDLVDPEIEKTRGLASMLKDDLKVDYAPKIVEMREIVAGVREGKARQGVVLTDVVISVNTLEGQKELIEKQTEIKSLISSIVGEMQESDLKNFKGMAELKIDIQREVNHQMTKGQVVDVLFDKFLIR